MFEPVTLGKVRTVHKYKYPTTTSETTVCGLRVPDVTSWLTNDDLDCEGCFTNE